LVRSGDVSSPTYARRRAATDRFFAVFSRRAHLRGKAHRRTVVSRLPVHACRPSGEKTTLKTLSVCSLKFRISLPLLRSHKRTVSSAPPVRARRLCGEKLTLTRESVCPIKTLR